MQIKNPENAPGYKETSNNPTNIRMEQGLDLGDHRSERTEINESVGARQRMAT